MDADISLQSLCRLCKEIRDSHPVLTATMPNFSLAYKRFGVLDRLATLPSVVVLHRPFHVEMKVPRSRPTSDQGPPESGPNVRSKTPGAKMLQSYGALSGALGHEVVRWGRLGHLDRCGNRGAGQSAVGHRRGWVVAVSNRV